MHRFIFILNLIFFNIVLIKSPVQAEEKYVKIDLIHRNSPLSPLYNNSITPSELIREAALRSLNRVNFFHSSIHIDEKDFEAELIISNLEDYLMRFYIGNPLVEVLAIIHLGGDFTWIQCYPCPNCYHQDAPLFIPGDSSTYHKVPYDNEYCQALNKKWAGPLKHCQYEFKYRVGTSTSGVLSNDSFHFETTNARTVPFPATIFGCGHDNKADFNSRVQGMVGLGRGRLSLIHQMNTRDNIEYKFSYCLLPMTSNQTSKLRFGSIAKISGPKVSIPLRVEHPRNYFIGFTSIQFGSKEIMVDFQGPREINIDIGLSFSILPSTMYHNLESMVKEVIDETQISNPPDPFSLCYQQESLADKHLPEMVFHFTAHDRINLKYINIFQPYNDLHCMTILPTTHNFSVLGSIAQVNFQVEFDLQNERVHFAEVDCTEF